MPKTHKKMRGFQYLLFSMFSCVLLSVLVLLPLNPVFADESVSDTESSPSEPVAEATSEPDTRESSSESEVASIETVDETTTDTEEGTTERTDEQNSTAEILESDVIMDDALTTDSVAGEIADVTTPGSPDVVADVDSNDSTVESGTEGDETESTDPSEPSGHTETSTTSVPTVTGEEDSGTTTSEFATNTPISTDIPESEPEDEPEESTEVGVEEELLDSTNTSSTPVVVTPGMIINDQNRFIFSKDECVRTGDGAFYCTEAEEAPTLMNTDRIFSALDEDGDKEIFIERSGTITAITQNGVDDDGPYYDEVSDTAVWHRLVDGRHQIVSYDFKEDTETMLTSEHYNNMQPNRFGEITVWQGWVGEDWEVFIEDGAERKMLTDNGTHDILPTVNGDHIVWQSFDEGAWKVKVYDRRTQITNTIENAEGGSVQNPRFVLVYDTETIEGDIETKGYDLKSGDVIELGSRPAQVPEELPDPDQTGEERALVTPNIQPKNKLGGNEEDDIDEGGIDFDNDLTDETGTTTDTLIIPPFSDGEASSTDSTTMPSVEDLFIESPDVSPYEHIEDVVVTPFASSSDPQVPIAED